MLTVENIKAVDGITEEQAAKIAELSKADEDKVIGDKFGEVYRNLDSIIEKSTGVKRNGDEKTYLYMERAANEVRAKATAATKQVEELTATNAKLQKAIADGSQDAETKAKLQQAEKDLAAITKQFNDLKTEYDGAKDKFAKDVFHVKIESEVANALGGVKFKEGLTPTLMAMAKNTVLSKVKESNPDSVDDGNGGKAIVFKDKDGAILRNQDNGLQPITVADIVTKELSAMGVLASKRKQTGSGGNGNNGGGNNTAIDISGATTQTEAYEAIAKTLFAKGLVNGSAEFDAEMQKAWKENNVAKLPQR